MDVIVEIRDADRNRIADLGDTTTFVCGPRRNDVGAWSVQLPADVILDDGRMVPNRVAELLRAPGAGIVATFPGGRVFSGPTETATLHQDTDDPGGTWQITGVSDLDSLAGEVAYPQPSNPAPGTQTQEVDYRQGPAETIMRAYVDANVGPGAPVERRIPGLTLAADLGRGGTAEGSPRFTPLLELLQSIANARGLLFDLVQVGTDLEFQVWEPADVTNLVRMDVLNDELAEAESAYGAPPTTEVIVLGRGLETMRTVIRRTNDVAQAAAGLWRRRRVAVIDKRSTDSVTELEQAADEELAARGDTLHSLRVTPSDQGVHVAGVDWWVGDWVTVTVAGEDMQAQVAEVRVSATEEGWLAGATIGDIAGYDPEDVMESRLTGVEQRVSGLERNTSADIAAMLDALIPAGTIMPTARAAAPSGWMLCQGQAVSRSTYAGLFAAIGTAYGAGNGSTTFNLPNLRGRTPVGLDTGQTEFNELGKTGGTKEETLSIAQMPAHTHVQNSHNHTQNSHNHSQNSHSHTQSAHSHGPADGGSFLRSSGSGANITTGGGGYGSSGSTSSATPSINSTTATNNAATATNNPTTATNQNTGGGGAHNNLPPYQVVNYQIKV